MLAALSGCYTMRADIPGTWRAPAPSEDVVIVGRVDHQSTHWFFLYGLLPAPAQSLHAEVLLREVEAAGGDGVANLVLDSEFTATDVFVRTISLGLVTPRSYRVRADIVQLPGPPPAGRPLMRHTRRRPTPPAPLPLSEPPQPTAPAIEAPTVTPPAAPVDPDELAPPALLGAP